jgi:ribose transport system ATP-binding protein
VLFALMARLRGEGVGIAYISHRMSEVFALADRVTVLRDGRHIVTAPASTVTRKDLIRHMVGREMTGPEKVAGCCGEVVLRGEGLVRSPGARRGHRAPGR